MSEYVHEVVQVHLIKVSLELTDRVSAMRGDIRIGHQESLEDVCRRAEGECDIGFSSVTCLKMQMENSWGQDKRGLNMKGQVEDLTS